MSIAVVVSELDIYGGTHKQVVRLCESLKKNGEDFSLVTGNFEPSKTYEEAMNLNVISILSKSKVTWLPNIVKRIIRQVSIYKLIPSKTNIINIHDNRLTIVGFLGKLFGKKVVWQINDLPPALCLGNSAKNRMGNIKGRIYTSWYKYMSSKVDLITVNVTKNKERVKEHFNLDAQVIYCGVDSFNENYVKRELQKEINILSSGVFFEYRNYESLIKAIAITNDKFRGKKTFTLDIIGSRKYQPEYAKEMEKLALELNVKLVIHSELPFSALSEIHEKASLFAFLNLDQSWGLSVFEAGTYSLPIILSNSVGAVELLSKSNGTFLVDPTNVEAISTAICEVVADQIKYNEYSLSAYSDCTSMTWDDMYCLPLLANFKKLLN